MKVKSIWRYPVKSMGGESLTQTGLSEHGVVGDRCYALHDGTATCSAKKYAKLMSFSARYDVDPDGIDIPTVTLELGQTALNSEDPDLERRLSHELGRPITLDRLRPAEDLEYYARSTEQQTIEQLRQILGLEEGEPFPDFSAFPSATFEYNTPPGSFFDAYPLLILTTNALNRLQQSVPETVIDQRRFRPNLLLDAPEFEADFIEEQWQGRHLEIGDAVIELTLPCPRCVMTTIAFQELAKAPRIMRALVQENHHKLGIYGRVVEPGTIRLDDNAQLRPTA